MKWNIGNKISGLIAFASLVFILLGGMSYLMINKLNTSIKWNTHTHLVLHANEMLMSDLKDLETGQRGYLITGDEKYLEPYNAAHQAIDQKLQEIVALTNDNPAQQQRLANMGKLIDSKIAELQETIDLRKQKGFDAALVVVLSDKGKTIMDDYRKLSTELELAENTLLNERELTMKSDASLTKLVIVGGSILAICLLIVVSYFLIRNISIPLDKVTQMAKLVAQGDLTAEITNTNREDEVGVLNRAFKQMIQVLSGSLKEINEGVNTLATASTQILAATTQVASGTAETAAAISETSTTVEEVQQSSKQSSQKAKNVADSAQRVVQVFQNGQKAVDDTISGMKNIREQMDSIAQTVVRLSEQSQSIGGIIASVTDIADQSNLLAVNAAIEAAKAGEQGKGFAVVAQEIKNLAGQSKQATLQVRNILNDIQKVTGAAVMATEQGSKAVESGLKQSMQAGEAIRILAESSNEAVQAATQIVASSQQQVVGMDQIGIAMQNINQAGTETAVSMVQAEKSAKNLFELGQKLKRLVDQYKI